MNDAPTPTSTYLETADVWTILDLIVAEFTSDPQSTLCFDARIVQRALTLIRKRRRRNTADDIGFDAIVDDPGARSVLLVATLHDEIGVRVFGPPSEATAEMLDHIATMYRRALAASRQHPQ